MRKSASVALAVAIGVLAAACAPKRFAAPTDAGAPLAGFAEAWQRIAAPCLGVRTLTAELGLSGRAGETRLRGRVQSGFAPGSMRLEGVAPFGQPMFILASTPSNAKLLLPRDERLVETPDAAEILDALVGVRLQSDMLMAVLAGCVMRDAPTSATEHGMPTRHGRLARFVFRDGEVFADVRGGALRVVAAQLQSFLIEYPPSFDAAMWPRRVRISRNLPGEQRVDLTIEISQMETNMTLPAEAFTIDIPPGTSPMTLAQLRAAGPLGARD